MSIYQQSDSLDTSTDVPMSGTGGSTPEPAAGNADYATWPWEIMLATVLGIPAPDRGKVTGQPWLTVLSDGQGAGGAHLIWTAGWDTSPNSGATSIQVYLNPALYTSGGAWDRFLNAPSQAMSGVTGGSYAGLPLKPPDFQAASLAVATVRNWIATAADHFASLYQQASSGPIAKFQGNLATVVAELLGDLRSFMASLHEQMTSPTPYDTSIAVAGEAAARFLTDLMSAYSGWTQVPEHSPLGAVVQVLEEIATQDPSGAYTIPDPQNTPYGDLTVSGSWGAVEQQAKTLWSNTLAGGSPVFAGLDPLGRAALSKLVDQFATTTSVIVPVVGPAPPAPTPNPVSPGGHSGGPGTPPPGSNLMLGGGNNQGPPGGPGGPGGPGHVSFAALTNNGLHGPAAPGGGPAGPGQGPASLAVNAPGAGGPAGQVPAPQPGAPPFGAAVPGMLLAAGPAGVTAPGSFQPGATGNTGGPALANDLAAGDVPAFANGVVSPGGLPGSIGATGGPRGLRDELAQSTDSGAANGGFSGTIGRPADPGSRAGSLRARDHRRGRRGRKAAALFGGRQAPAPGFSLGRDPAGPVLKQLAVPAIVAKPPAITSSPVNSQLVPASAGAGGPGGLSASAPSAGPQAQASSAPVPEAAPAGMGEPAMLVPGAAGAGGIGASGTDAAGLAAGGPAAGEGGPMIMPPGGMGMRGGQASRERQRLAYLPEEPEYWGTAPASYGTCLGAGGHADPNESAEPEFVPVMTAALGSGARPEHGPAGEPISDRRKP